MKWFVLAYLAAVSLEDMMKKTVSLWLILLGNAGAAGWLMWNCVKGQMVWQAVILSILPAILFLIIAKVSKEQVGYGDGWLMLPLGIILGFEKMCMVLMWAISLAAVCALILLVKYRYRRGMEMPFVPFLLTGYVLMGGLG